MINFQLGGVMTALEFVRQHTDIAMSAVQAGKAGEELDPSYKSIVENNLQWVHKKCGDLLLQAAEDRVVRIWNIWTQKVSYGGLAIELKPLLEALEDDLRKQYFYHYPRHKALVLMMVPGDWVAAFKAFPSIRPEVETGVDCYALGHNTACVFHMMRVAEFGLRAIARERRIKTVRRSTPLEWGTWGDVLKAISDKLEVIRQATAGPKKDAALAFYHSASSDLRALQDLYRDRTFHLRENYDDGQAQTAMIRTRELMDALAARLSEASNRQINWGI